MNKKLVSSTLEQLEAMDGDDAAAVLLAAIGTPPRKSVAKSLGISLEKTKRSKSKKKSTKPHLDSLKLQSPDRSEKKLTMVDLKLRALVESAEPGKSYTLQEIAEVIGVSRERVRQIEEQGMRKLRNKLYSIIKSDGVDREEFQQ